MKNFPKNSGIEEALAVYLKGHVFLKNRKDVFSLNGPTVKFSVTEGVGYTLRVTGILPGNMPTVVTLLTRKHSETGQFRAKLKEVSVAKNILRIPIDWNSQDKTGATENLYKIITALKGWFSHNGQNLNLAPELVEFSNDYSKPAAQTETPKAKSLEVMSAVVVKKRKKNPVTEINRESSAKALSTFLLGKGSKHITFSKALGKKDYYRLLFAEKKDADQTKPIVKNLGHEVVEYQRGQGSAFMVKFIFEPKERPLKTDAPKEADNPTKTETPEKSVDAVLTPTPPTTTTTTTKILFYTKAEVEILESDFDVLATEISNLLKNYGVIELFGYKRVKK